MTMRETISLDELRIMVHMSKRRVAYLLNSGLIPCEIRQRATHRYVIRRADAEQFAKDYMTHPEKYQVSGGVFSSVRSETALLTVDPERFRAYLKVQWREMSDILIAPDVEALIGYNQNTIRRWMKEERLSSVWLSDDRITTALWLIDLLVSGYGATITGKSEKHLELMRMK